MTRKQTKAALLASVKATADDNHLDGIDDFAVLHFLGHEAEMQPRGRRWRSANQCGRGPWMSAPRLSHSLEDLLRTMKEEHGREICSIQRVRGDYVATVTARGNPKSPLRPFRHPDLIHATLGAFLASVD